MYKKIVGLIGAVTAFVAPHAAKAFTGTPNSAEVLQVQSYADLLNPIPNAAEVLRTLDAAPSNAPARIEKTQYYHHHHHHHHHHHNWWGWGAPPWGYRPYYYHHHHHHHHHHHNYY